MLTLWVPAVVWAALIYYLSSLPGSTFPSPFAYADKVFHLGMYAVLGYLVARALGCSGRAGRVIMMLALLLCLIYGVSDEIHQSFIPDRVPSVTDIVADVFGSVLGIRIYTRKR